MKQLLLLFLLFPLLAFGQVQGTAIRALSGYGTNTLFFNNLGFPIRQTADMASGFLFDFSAGNLSVDWDSRELWDGTVVSMDWFNRTFSGTAWKFLTATNHTDVSAGAYASGNVWGYDGITDKWTNGPPGFVALGTLKTNTILSVTIGGAVATGNPGVYSVAGGDYTISGWAINAVGTAPTITFDIWKIGAGTALPTVANTILGTKPALAVGNVIQSSTLTAWNVAVTEGEIWGVNVDAVSGATNVTLQIYGYR